MAEEFFKSMVFQLLQNALASQTIEFRNFYLCPQGKTLSHVLVITLSPQAEGNYSFPSRNHFFLKIYPPAKRREKKNLCK